MNKFRLVLLFSFAFLIMGCASPEPVIFEVPVLVENELENWEYLMLFTEIIRGTPEQYLVIDLQEEEYSPSFRKDDDAGEVFSSLHEILNKYGADGWELAKFDRLETLYAWEIVFKRPIK
jgi:hypothetical protein